MNSPVICVQLQLAVDTGSLFKDRLVWTLAAQGQVAHQANGVLERVGSRFDEDRAAPCRRDPVNGVLNGRVITADDVGICGSNCHHGA